MVSTLDTSEGAGFVAVNEEHNLQFHYTEVSFSTPDCTGQAYIHVEKLSRGIDGALGLAPGPNQHLWAGTGPPIETTVSINSSLDSPGNCYIFSANWTNMVPVTDVGDLSAEFTAPFYIETATTHYAAMPISFGWLLGGVMLGFGIKAAVKKS